MRLHETAADEPRLVTERLDHRHRRRGDLAIRLIVIRAIRGAPLAPLQGTARHIAALQHLAACLGRIKCLRAVPRATHIHPALFRFRILAAAEMEKLPKRM